MQDRDALVLANKGDGRVVLAPIFFNGKARIALAYLGEHEGCPFLKILGVCLDHDDLVLDQRGTPAGVNPPVPEKRSLN
jgi:hypothetical protein